MSLPQVPLDPGKEPDWCFVCGRSNPIGLHVKLRKDGNKVVTEFTPEKVHQGWSGIVHGGIIHCLLDEAISWAALYEGLACVTAKMEARWRRPAHVGETLLVTGWITRNTRRLVEAEANITLRDGTVVAEGTGMMYVVKKGDPATYGER